ncbi:phage N-6-adenine-methyltransferase [Leminorella grimontii]|uniref:phage N-6-adenine-methyltransferase n=1 Tax=Leminorella grimontii TaxID=82981 RepID=UPI00208517CC|nr:phage N-6-adenine-methyltransferase [Leminorella grimontii]GKX58366.1 phage N-6-adenine-methyltransferase [Leminorella grimontii]
MSRTNFGGSSTPEKIRDLWQTPPEIYAALDAEFHFVADVAASVKNHLHPRYLTKQDDALVRGWGDMPQGFVWCNPPYSDIGPWVRQAEHAAIDGVGTVMLVPADMSVEWFRATLDTASEVRVITGGRLAFIREDTGEKVNGNPKGSMLLIWRPRRLGTKTMTFANRDDLMAAGAALLAEREAA